METFTLAEKVLHAIDISLIFWCLCGLGFAAIYAVESICVAVSGRSLTQTCRR